MRSHPSIHDSAVWWIQPASQPACTHPARSVILRRQSIRYACSISNSHMHPSNCKICDRIHPCMIQLYGGSSQPASQPASAASLSVTLIKIVDRSHYSPTAGSPRARPRRRGRSGYDAPLSLAPPGHPRVVSAPPAPRQRAVDGVDRQHIRSDVCTMPRGRKLRDEDGDAQHEGHGSYGLSD